MPGRPVRSVPPGPTRGPGSLVPADKNSPARALSSSDQPSAGPIAKTSLCCPSSRCLLSHRASSSDENCFPCTSSSTSTEPIRDRCFSTDSKNASLVLKTIVSVGAYPAIRLTYSATRASKCSLRARPAIEAIVTFTEPVYAKQSGDAPAEVSLQALQHRPRVWDRCSREPQARPPLLNQKPASHRSRNLGYKKM